MGDALLQTTNTVSVFLLLLTDVVAIQVTNQHGGWRAVSQASQRNALPTPKKKA